MVQHPHAPGFRGNPRPRLRHHHPAAEATERKRTNLEVAHPLALDDAYAPAREPLRVDRVDQPDDFFVTYRQAP